MRKRKCPTEHLKALDAPRSESELVLVDSAFPCDPAHVRAVLLFLQACAIECVTANGRDLFLSFSPLLKARAMERVAANGHLGAATDVGQRQQPAFSLSGLFIASALKKGSKWACALHDWFCEQTLRFFPS